jgi:GNAT superfamily N-acetyltransferase
VTFEIAREQDARNGWYVNGTIRATISQDEDDDDEPEWEDIGHLFAYYIREISDWREDVYTFADGESDDAGQLADIDPEHFEDPVASWLGVLSMKINDAWRGKKIGFIAMRELIELFEDPFMLITCQPHPITGKEIEPGLIQYPSPEEMERAKPGQQKLQKYWYKFGFRPVPGSRNIYAHHCARTWPERSWMRRPR